VRRSYYYQERGVWVTRSRPRLGLSVNVLFASPSVRMDFHDSPSRHHADIVRRYPGNSLERDSRQSFKQDVRQDVRQDIRENTRQDARKDVRQDIRRDTREDARNNLRSDINQGPRKNTKTVKTKKQR
jgi:hypothetical protein